MGEGEIEGGKRQFLTFLLSEGVCVWDIQHRGFITERGLSSKQAWRILCLEREKEHSCPDYHVEGFFALAFLEVSTALLRCDTATEPSVRIL